MKLKTIVIEGKTYAEVDGDKPIYTHDDGKDAPFDAAATVAKIGQLNGEAKAHRTAKEAAEAKLAKFEGIDDPAAAIKALGTVKNLDDKKLVDAGEVERVKAAVKEALEAQYKPIVEERDRLLGENKAEKLGNAFGKSKVISDKLILPADAVQKLFGDHFNVENGKIVAKDRHGNVINSRAKPGDPADFDEAMEALIDGYAYKDTIMKGIGHQGDNKRASNGNGSAAGQKTMSRAEFDNLDPGAQMNAMTGKERVSIVD